MDWYERYVGDLQRWWEPPFPKPLLTKAVEQCLKNHKLLSSSFSFSRMAKVLNVDTDTFFDAARGGWQFSMETRNLYFKLQEMIASESKPFNKEDWL